MSSHLPPGHPGGDPGPAETRSADGKVLPLAAVTGSALQVPLIQGGWSRYVNLDYAASTPALETVVSRVNEALGSYASVHRSAGYASIVSTAAYDAARATVASFVRARADDVVVFTRNTTDALNLLASVAPGPAVYLDIEHHANMLPWQRRQGRVMTARQTMAATMNAIGVELARQRPALLTVTGASNVTGECFPLPDLAALAHRHGARLAVDGAQLVPHRPVDMAAAGIDYLAFSGHKLYAPFGSGALVGARDWLDAAPPYLAGGGAVREVTLATVTWARSPARHEGGTPNLLGAVALAQACQDLSALPAGAAVAHEQALISRLRGRLAELGATIYRIWPDSADRVGIVTFSLPGTEAGLLAAYLSAEHGIGVRDGRFCAHPLLARLGTDRAVRASLGLGSGSEDIDRLTSAVAEFLARGPSWHYEQGHGGWIPVPDPRPATGGLRWSPCDT